MKVVEAQKVKDFFINSHKKFKISNNRKEKLSEIVTYIVNNSKENDLKIHLNFICTHNSRRSQIAQVWATYASIYFGTPQIKAFSGGTEVTAFHKNTLAALETIGFQFQLIEMNHDNPKYEIKFEDSKTSILGFSKHYDNPINSKPFIAITTCSSAHENCPFIPDAQKRFHLPYVDPKGSDDTDEMTKAYLQTNQQIASELFYIFSEVKKGDY